MSKLNYILLPETRFKPYDKRHYKPSAYKNRAKVGARDRSLNRFPVPQARVVLDIVPMDVDDPKEIDPHPRPAAAHQPAWHNVAPQAHVPLAATPIPIGQPINDNLFLNPNRQYSIIAAHRHHIDVDVLMFEDDYIPYPPIIPGYIPVDLPEAMDVDLEGSLAGPSYGNTFSYPQETPQYPVVNDLPPPFYNVSQHIEDNIFFAPITNMLTGNIPWLNNGLHLQGQEDVSFCGQQDEPSLDSHEVPARELDVLEQGIEQAPEVQDNEGEANRPGDPVHWHTELFGDDYEEEEDYESPAAPVPPWVDTGGDEEDDEDEVEFII